jgi:uncharacterized integral membrane protein
MIHEYIQIYLLGYLIFSPILYSLRFINEKLTLSDGAIIGWPFMWPILAPIFFGSVVVGFLFGFFKSIFNLFNNKK